jgi:MSHA biogenesis protein MshP
MRRSSSQRGMTLVAALFLIVVLGALGLFAIRMGTAQQETANLEMLSDRATAAAHMGIEWAAIRTAALGCPAPNNPVVLTPNLAGTALAGFRVTVRCTVLPGPTYRITSEARFGAYGTHTFVSRTVIARLPT